MLRHDVLNLRRKSLLAISSYHLFVRQKLFQFFNLPAIPELFVLEKLSLIKRRKARRSFGAINEVSEKVSSR
jgi:hypothetical protein